MPHPMLAAWDSVSPLFKLPRTKKLLLHFLISCATSVIKLEKKTIELLSIKYELRVIYKLKVKSYKNILKKIIINID